MRLSDFLELRQADLVAQALSHADERGSATPRDEMAAYLANVVAVLARGTRDGASSADLEAVGAAAKPIGEQQQRHGASPSAVTWSFGAISVALGDLAGGEGLHFGADEYGAFNRCLDTAVATAIEHFSSHRADKREHENVARMARLGHELRNALGTARLAFEHLRLGEVGIRSRTGDLLERSLVRMDGLIRNTMAAARLETESEPATATLELGSLVREVVAGIAPDRGVRIEVEVVDALRVQADELLLVSAVGNLVQNGVKFTRPGGRVQIRMQRQDDRAVIEIEDECGGLRTEDPQELFIPFVQRASDRRGLGLGLPIARDAVRAHGGELDVRDLPGTGCVFRLELPVMTGPSHDDSAR